MSFREVGINIASMGKCRNVLFSVCLAPLFLIAASSSASAANAGGSCSKANVVSGTVLKPLVCKKVNGKLKWVLAPGGSCQALGAMSGTVSKPWVCKKVNGKLRWVEVEGVSTATTVVNSGVTATTQMASATKSTVPPAASSGSSRAVAATTTTTSTTTTTTTIPVVCPSGTNIAFEITSATDGSYRTTGSAVKMYYYTRNVQGVIRNNSSVPVSVINLSLSGNLLKDGAVYQSQTVYVVGNVTVAPGGAYGWNVSYEALGHRATWSDYSTVGRNETIQTATFVASDIRCQ